MFQETLGSLSPKDGSRKFQEYHKEIQKVEVEVLEEFLRKLKGFKRVLKYINGL